jgi:signal transduction histidine kinase
LLDKNDFLWITTQNGLVRFDGRRFRIYDKSNTPAIRSNRFAIIGESSQREVLLGSTFDPAEIYRVGPDYNVVIDTPRTQIRHKFLHLDSKGFFDCTPLFRHYAHPARGIDTLFLNRLSLSETYVILNDHEIAVRDGPTDWYYLNNSSLDVHKLPLGPGATDAHVFVLDGIFYVFSGMGGWHFFTHGRDTTIPVDKTVSALIGRVSGTPQGKTIIGPGGDQVILRDGKDIYEIGRRNGVLHAELVFPDLKILDNIIATSFLLDRQNQRLFIATVTTGFIIVTKKMFRSLAFNSTDPLDNAFKAFLLLSGKKVLTQNGILGRDNESNHHLFPPGLRPDGNCFYRAKDRTIWASKDKRLHIYDSNFSALLTVDSLPLDSYISCIIEDRTGVIWISTLMSLLRMENGRLRYVFSRDPRFAKHNIETIAQPSPATLWIGTRDGIYVYDIAKGRLNENPLFPHVYARNFYRARDSSLWIGTYGNGYYKYCQGKFVSFPVDPHNYLSTAHTFLEDGFGFFWIDTNHGLYRVNKKELDDYAMDSRNSLYYYYIDKSYGFNTNEFNGGCNPSSQVDDDGNFYFPSLDGIVYFNPGKVHLEVPDKPIFVDDLFVDLQRYDYRKSLSIKPDFQQIVVDVTTPFYGLEENLNLEYTLDSVGGKWYPVTPDGRITINRLPHGKYALLIRKNNGNLQDQFTQMAITFVVRPHWYSTWYFYALLIIASASLFYLLYLLRTRLLVRQNIRLQRKVEERTSQLAQSTSIKEQLLSVIMHDMRSPMFSQALLIDHLQTNYHKLSRQELNELFFLLKDSSDRICQFSSDFLAWYDSQKSGFSIKNENIELAGFIREITVLYKNIAFRKGLSLDYDLPPGIVLYSDRNILAIVIRNLVDNAVKYTDSGTVGIKASQDNDRIHIQVKDSGPGMSAEKIREITSVDEMDKTRTAPGFGYRFITELTRKLNGELAIDSEPGKGTAVTVSFKA